MNIQLTALSLDIPVINKLDTEDDNNYPTAQLPRAAAAFAREAGVSLS